MIGSAQFKAVFWLTLALGMSTTAKAPPPALVPNGSGIQLQPVDGGPPTNRPVVPVRVPDGAAAAAPAPDPENAAGPQILAIPEGGPPEYPLSPAAIAALAAAAASAGGTDATDASDPDADVQIAVPVHPSMEDRAPKYRVVLGVPDGNGGVMELSPGQQKIQSLSAQIEGGSWKRPFKPIPDIAGNKLTFKKLFENQCRYLGIDDTEDLNQVADNILSGTSGPAEISALQDLEQNPANEMSTRQAISAIRHTKFARIVVSAYLAQQPEGSVSESARISDFLEIMQNNNGDLVANSNKAIGYYDSYLSAEAYYFDTIMSQSWRAQITRTAVPSNIDDGLVEHYQNQCDASGDLPAHYLSSFTGRSINLSKNWTYLVKHLLSKVEVQKGEISFDGDSITLSSKILSGNRRWLGGDKLVSRIAAAMYATGDVRPESIKDAISFVEVQKNPNASVVQDLLRVASGSTGGLGSRDAKVGDYMFSKQDVSDNSILKNGPAPINFAQRHAFFLAMAVNPGAITKAQLEAHLRLIGESSRDPLTSGLEQVKNALEEIDPDMDSSRTYELFKSWWNSNKGALELADNLFIRTQDLREAMNVVQQGLTGEYSLADIDRFKNSNPVLRLDDQVRATLMYNQITGSNINQSELLAFVAGANAPADLIRVLTDEIPISTRSSISVLEANMLSVAELAPMIWAATPPDLTSLAATRRAIGEMVTENPEDIDIEKDGLPDYDDVIAGAVNGSDMPIAALTPTFFQVITGQPQPENHMAMREWAPAPPGSPEFSAIYLVPTAEATPGSATGGANSFVGKKADYYYSTLPNGLIKLLTDATEQETADAAIQAEISRGFLQENTGPETVSDILGGDGETSDLTLSDFTGGADSGASGSEGGTSGDGNRDREGEGGEPVEGM